MALVSWDLLGHQVLRTTVRSEVAVVTPRPHYAEPPGVGQEAQASLLDTTLSKALTMMSGK